MKLKFLLLALIIIWGSGCVAYVTPHGVVTVDVTPPRTVVRVVTTPVVRHVHHQHCGHTVSHHYRHVDIHGHHRRSVVRHSRHHYRSRTTSRRHGHRRPHRRPRR